MLVGDLSNQELDSRLTGGGLGIQFGPFSLRLQSNLRGLAAQLQPLYRLYHLETPDAVYDFHIRLRRPGGLRRWIRPQVRFDVDGRSPFAPYASEHALPALEWGINWCIATRAHHLLMLHAAVVERNGKAMLLPAWPGHGKSTLCAALVHSGWRLLSDEFALIRPEDGAVLPLPRLIPLKNESIDVIRRFSPDTFIGPAFHGTRKGTVAHVRPPVDSISRAHETADPAWLVFPRWIAGAQMALETMPKSRAFLMVATNAFNYDVLHEQAFRMVASMVDCCGCYSLMYSNLSEAVSALSELARADS